MLEHHFLQQHKPSTNVKKEFATKLGVPLDKINVSALPSHCPTTVLIALQNWFQNRRAKVKQDRKKAMNQMTMGVGLPFPPTHLPVMPTNYAPHPDQQHSHLPMHSDFFPVNADISPASLPVQSIEGPSSLDLGSHLSLQQQFDMQHALRPIPEADRTTSYHPNPNAVMHSIMAATNGAYMHNGGLPINPTEQAFPYDTNGLPTNFSNDLAFVVPAPISNEGPPSHPAFAFADFALDYSTLSAANMTHSTSADIHRSTGSISSEPSPFSGAQSTGRTTQSPNGPTPASVASVASLYIDWTEDPTQTAQPKQEDESEDQFATPYNLTQASASEHTLPFWGGRPDQTFGHPTFYHQANASAHAILSSPPQDGSRKLSSAPSEYDYSPVFHEDAFARRNSSTSNLAHNMDSIQIRNGTPDDLIQSNQSSSIAARRQKRPVTLSSTSMRSSSYSAPMPSPGGSHDHTLRRIRSNGIGNGGRVQKSQPNSAPRSPITMTFSDAAASPKFARAFSSSSATTINQGGSLAPPTPQTPQDCGNYWQSNTVIKPHSVMPEHNSPESMHTPWSVEPQPGNSLAKSSSPSTTSLDLQAHRVANDAIYGDTPPQSAPATQQNFPPTNFVQQSHMPSGFHSSTDLTLQQPKPSHFRRPSLPDSAQGQLNEPNLHYLQTGNLNYDDFKDISLNGIHHNVPFAPPVSAMPDFLVHQYNPPEGTDMHGNLLRRAGEPQPKSFIFANQGPSDFRH